MKLFSKNSNLCDHITDHGTETLRTDGRTDLLSHDRALRSIAR